jgi:hypothetical protein
MAVPATLHLATLLQQEFLHPTLTTLESLPEVAAFTKSAPLTALEHQRILHLLKDIRYPLHLQSLVSLLHHPLRST